MRRLSPLVGPACLLALLLSCFGSVLFRDHQFAYRDAGHFYYPLYLRVQQEWAAHRLPLWEPEENGGMPLLGNPTAAVLYPGKLIFAAAPSYAWGTRLYTVAHVLLAVAAMYAMCRSWDVSRSGSTIAGLAYGFAAPVLFQYCNIIFLVGAAWAPLGLRAADRWLRLGRRWAMGELALVLAMQTLGGDPQAAYVLGLCAGGYALGLAWMRRERRPRWPAWAVALAVVAVAAAWSAAVLYAAYLFPQYRPQRKPPEPLPWMPYVNGATRVVWILVALPFALAWLRGKREPLARMLGGLVVAALLAIGLTAVQLVPVLEFTGQTVRAAAGGPHDVYPFSLDPYQVVDAAFPNLFGTAFRGNTSWLSMVPPERHTETWVPSVYAGGLTLVLALAALGLRGGPPWRAWLTAIAALSLVAALGKFASPIWVARNFADAVPWIGPHDRPIEAAIRFDGKLRDGDGSIYWLMTAVLPGFREFRYPSKLLTFTALAVAALAGIGWDRVVAGSRRRASTTAAIGLAIGAAGLVFALAARGRILAFFETNPAIKVGSSFGPFQPSAAWSGLVGSLAQGCVVMGLTLALIRLARGRPRLAGLAAPVVLAADLALANSGMVLTVPQSMFETPPELLKRIEQAERDEPTPGGLYRVHRTAIWLPYIWQDTPSKERHREFVEWERKTLQPKYAVPYGLCYTLTQGTAELYDYEFFFASFEWKPAQPGIPREFLDEEGRVIYYSRRGFDMWNTRYFLLPYRPGFDEHRGIASFLFNIDPEPIAPREEERDADWFRREDWQLFRNKAAYPRAWVVHDAKFWPPIVGLARKDRERLALEMLHQADPIWNETGKRHVYNPQLLAWIETNDTAPLQRFRSRLPHDPSEIPKFVRYEPQRVEMDVDLKTPGFVVLAEVYYPGWRLTIDGKPAEILRANRLMRGAAVDAGRHRLVFTYEPASLRVGASITAVAAFALAALGLWSFRRPASSVLAPGLDVEDDGLAPEGSPRGVDVDLGATASENPAS